MSFNISLTGLSGAQSELSVTGNNLANANTVGFKHARAEFGDMYASMMGNGSDRAGMGVKTQRISQEHSQGSFDFTERSLDMAIDGSGYFILNNDGATEYTRAGYFDLDRDGFVVNNEGKRLQGYPAGDPAGEQGQAATLENLQVPNGLTPQKLTTQANVEVNLDSRTTFIDRAETEFDANDSNTYHFARELDVFDSLGSEHTLTQYFTLTEEAEGTNTWETRFALDGEEVGETTLTFDPNGALEAVDGEDVLDDEGNPIPENLQFTLEQDALTGAVGDDAIFEAIQVGFDGSTQYGATSAVISLGQNGYASGNLAGLSVNDEGWLMGRYTNGENLRIGRLAVATFINPQGLDQIGSNSWVETPDSGLAAVNPPGTGRSGQVLGGALEQSTVDVSEELVKMLIAQRNFQANSKAIQTQNTLSETIINLR